MEKRYLSVYALNQYLKAKFNQDVALQNVYIKGEISNYRPHPSGHLYFTLKDENSRISAVMFASAAKKLDFDIENGMQVLIHAQVSVYEVSGQYQLYVKTIEQDGIGQLYLKYEALKKKLFVEGLFDEEHKKAIPVYPRGIAVLSAKQGAGLQDILRTIHLRFPFTKVIVFPIPVQGQGAYLQIIHTLKQVDKLGFDTIILARGGGSIEDLWNFNEEDLARCIYDLNTPLISGVGHETDFTICDFVSDYRAATPTAAAVKATPNQHELKQQLNQLNKQLNTLMKQKIDLSSQRLTHLKNSYTFMNPEMMYSNEILRLNHLQDRLIHCYSTFDEHVFNDIVDHQNQLKHRIDNLILQKDYELKKMIATLDALSPLKVMQRGYTIIKKDDHIINSGKQLNKGDCIQIQFIDEVKKAKIE